MGSLRGRLGIALGGVAAVSVAIASVVAFGLVRRHAEATALDQLMRLGEAVALEARVRGRDFRPVRRLLDVSGTTMTTVLSNGVVGEGAEWVAGIDHAPLIAGERIRGTASAGETELAYVGFPVIGGGPVRGVVLSRPIDFARDIWGPVVVRLLLAAIAAVLAAIALSAWLAQRMTRPLTHLAGATAAIAGGSLDVRVPVESGDELGRLAGSFNEMAGGLQEARRREREFLANVSHELRTPLTAIRGYLEAIEEGAVEGEEGRAQALGIVRAETERLERLVGDVMSLARLGAEDLPVSIQPVDIVGTLRDAVAAKAAQAAAANVRLEGVTPPSLTVETDPGRLRQVVDNLVENALRVTGAGGSVRVSAREEAGLVRVEVTDTGPGIPAEHLPHVFERSYLRNVTGEPNGAGRHPAGGLGLAIVRELARALGGDVSVRSEVGRGTTFTVVLPVVRPART